MRQSSNGSLVCVSGLLMAAIVCSVSVRASSEPNEPPVIPVGLDAYRQWDRWPYQRIGARAYMRSTYDRRGGNEGADASHFLYQLGDDFNVTLDVAGPGVLYFARYNHWHGSPWHYEVDGVDHIVRETGTADPVNAKSTLKETVFIPEEPFPESADVDLVHDQRGGSDVGAAAVRADVSHGLFAHALRHRLLHLSPLRPQCAALAAHPLLGRQDAAGQGCAGPAESRGHRYRAADRARRRATAWA